MRRISFLSLVFVGWLALPSATLGLDDRLAVKVDTWTSDGGRAYVGVTSAGNWAPPAEQGTRVRTEFYSEWQNQGNPGAYCNAWWVTVHRTADGSIVNFDSPVSMVLCGPEPTIGLTPSGYGDLSLYLAVSVEPVTAPARSQRSVVAELTAGWRDYVDDAISAFVRSDTVRVERWTIDFGDGTRQVLPGNTPVPDRLVATHAYEAGEFEVTATARVSGEAYGAFFTPDGTPFEEVVPFTLDISNRASGVSALPIEYVPPVVAPGGSPSGSIPGGGVVTPAAEGLPNVFWPRGLPCDLFVRAIVEQEGFMRSGGVVIGSARTRLLSYRYLGGQNDASGGSGPGTYDAASPLRLQWNTPLPESRAHPVRVELNVETTYEDGTVRNSTAQGTIGATVIYSAVSQ